MNTQLILALISAVLISFGVLPSAESADAVKSYPRKTCLVTDNKLGSMGTPVTKVYGSQEVKFCCKSCISKFEKDPAKYLAKLTSPKPGDGSK